MFVSNPLFITLGKSKDKIKTCFQRAKNYILNIIVQQIWIHYAKKKKTQRISSEGKYKHLHILISGISCSASLLIVICMFCWLNDPPHKFFIVLCKQHSNVANDVLFIFWLMLCECSKCPWCHLQYFFVKSHYFPINITIRATFSYRLGYGSGLKSLGHVGMCMSVCFSPEPINRRGEKHNFPSGLLSICSEASSARVFAICDSAASVVFPLIKITNLILTLLLWSRKWTVSDCYLSQALKNTFRSRYGYPALTVPTHIPDKQEHFKICASLSYWHERGVYHPIFLFLSFCFFQTSFLWVM